jgi:predicted TIM-barrel fold metal-dependent hydrolase
MKDSDAGLAAVSAYSDWELDEWCGTDPNRFISCQLPWLRDPEIAANGIRRNAERGFVSVSFSENQEIMGFQSPYSGKWDDFFQACADTDTVSNLHIGSAGRIHKPSTDSPTDVTVALFLLCGIETVVDWIYARIPVKFPGLKIVLSEAGIPGCRWSSSDCAAPTGRSRPRRHGRPRIRTP